MKLAILLVAVSVLLSLASLAAPASAPAVSLYVAADGNDSNPGTEAGPFATIQRARDAIRELKESGPLAAGGVTVWVARGAYPLKAGLELAAQDSGAADAPIVYRARPGDEVHLLGGREVAGFKPVTDAAVLARLCEPARGKVVQADLKAQGIGDFGRFRSRGFGRPVVPAAMELFFRDRPMPVARWPNGDFVRIKSIPQGQGGNDEHGGTIGKLTGGFHYEGDRPRRWKTTEDVWVHGYWAWDWANSYEKVESIDLDNRLIKTAPPHGQYGFRAGQRFYFLNVLEELDEPGEWYLDRATGILYFWPPAPVSENRALVSVLEQPMVSMRDVQHVRLSGLVLECTRGAGVRITGGRSNLVAGCTVRNIGDDAVVIEGGRDHAVVSCDISETGDAGVRAHGGDRKTLASSGHRVHNNHFHHIGRWSKCYVPAVLAEGVGVSITHNLIHDHPHCAILFGGNEHLIEFNEIHHVCLETGDVGAIYTGRDWTYLGNIIRHNYIHDTGGVGMGSMGVYMDDCAGGAAIVGNVFQKVQRAAFIGGGRHNRVENNVFVDCRPAVQIDGRGLDKSPVWHNQVYQTMKKRLDEMNPKQPPYGTKYPELAELDKYYAAAAGVPPEGNIVENNISWGGKWLDIIWHAKPEMVRVANNLTDKDPLFVDAAGGDFRLKPGSPALGMGFKQIPMARIGLERDEYRTSLPARR